MHEAVSLQRSGRHAEAAERYRELLRGHPDHPDVVHLFGMTERDLGRPESALEWLERAAALRPGDPAIRANLGTTLQMAWRHDRAAEELDRAVAASAPGLGRPGHPGHAAFRANRLLAAHYHPDVTLEDLDRLHRAWDAAVAGPVRRLPEARRAHAVEPDPDRSLRVGFVSPDLGVHPVGIFLVGLLEHLPPGLHATCYALRVVDDPVARRLRDAAGGWVDAGTLDERALAARIRADRIDVLVDLAGHTQANRIRTFALRPAPVQATWMGYVGTTGLAEMDLLVADPHQLRPEDEAGVRERVVRLPHDYVLFDPPAGAPEPGPLPAAARGHVTFGSFNNPAKLNEPLLATWARVLQAVPGSRLRLRYQGFGDPALQARVREALRRGGVEPERIELGGRIPRTELLAAWADVDLALDPHPYSGGLTTLEALWMGVPVLTRPGRTFASRHSLTHLRAVGLEECVCGDDDALVTRAATLATDRDRLAALRAGLRARVRASPLCDPAGFGRDVEAVLREAWRQWCRTRGAPAGGDDDGGGGGGAG